MPHPAEALIDVLRNALADGPALRLALLFGSNARGRSRPDSDVDLGILPMDPELSLHAELDLQAKLERACGRPVHLIRLDHAGTLLNWNVARYGVPVITRSPADHTRFIAAAALEYADVAPALARAEAVFRERVQASLGRTEAG